MVLTHKSRTLMLLVISRVFSCRVSLVVVQFLLVESYRSFVRRVVFGYRSVQVLNQMQLFVRSFGQSSQSLFYLCRF